MHKGMRGEILSPIPDLHTVHTDIYMCVCVCLGVGVGVCVCVGVGVCVCVCVWVWVCVYGYGYMYGIVFLFLLDSHFDMSATTKKTNCEFIPAQCY